MKNMITSILESKTDSELDEILIKVVNKIYTFNPQNISGFSRSTILDFLSVNDENLQAIIEEIVLDDTFKKNR